MRCLRADRCLIVVVIKVWGKRCQEAKGSDWHTWYLADQAPKTWQDRCGHILGDSFIHSPTALRAISIELEECELPCCPIVHWTVEASSPLGPLPFQGLLNQPALLTATHGVPLPDACRGPLHTLPAAPASAV